MCCVIKIVTAWLKLASVGLRQAGGGRCSCDLFLTVISVYAPTFRAPRHIKETFWNDLHGCLAGLQCLIVINY